MEVSPNAVADPVDQPRDDREGQERDRASVGSIQKRSAAVMAIMKTSVRKSSRLIERKLQIRSVSLLSRDIRSPVRLPPKYSSESCWRCS